ncbi:MAG: DUF4173 domain-containing protein [Salinivirgaceae bacterium]
MKKNVALLLILIHSVAFVWLFHKQEPGLNLFIFELLSLASLWFILKERPQSTASKIVLAGTLISGLAMVIYFSDIALFINICAFYLYSGTLVFPQSRSLLSSALFAVSNTFRAPGRFFALLFSFKGSNQSVTKTFRGLKIALLPLVVIAIFIALYKASNPLFDKGVTELTAFIDRYWDALMHDIDLAWLFTFLLGLFFSLLLFIHVQHKRVLAYESGQDDVLKRIRKKHLFGYKLTALNDELKSALFLLISLNLLLLTINSIDIYWVWFNFEWEGEYLKQFVHEGTYLLIISILISIALVLFFFRRNLNFYARNKTLKLLSYAWLAQNAVLALSVAMRNFWYIKYFALAYKRIGVLVFLVLTLYGIYTVYQKVRHQKSAYYLWRTNSLATFVMLVLLTMVNWDAVIARYNFSHYRTAFVHLNFLSNLSDKTLPLLDKSLEELKAMEAVQKELFPFEEQYMDAEAYHKKIQLRKEYFMSHWNEKNLRSWNFAEARAYKALSVVNK